MFSGTGHEIFGNLNAPPAVTASAVIYCLRCLLADTDIPLNQVRLTSEEKILWVYVYNKCVCMYVLYNNYLFVDR